MSDAANDQGDARHRRQQVPPESAAQDRLDSQINHLYRSLRQLRRELGPKLSHYLEQGITASQYIAVRLLHDDGPLTVSEVADQLGVTLSAVTALADRLEDNDLVERRRDVSDRRVVELHLLQEGRELVHRVDEGRRQAMRQYFEPLKAEDIDRLNEIIDQVVAVVADVEGDAR